MAAMKRGMNMKTTRRLLTCLLALFMALALLPAAAFAAGDVVINTTNFPDANFRSVVKQFDLDGNNLLSAAEIQKVTVIECYEKGISNLQGITYFTELKELYCGNNKLTSLNVSSLKKLETLYCQKNQLTTLNVSGCAALKDLSCWGNKLTSIDVSRNTALELLSVRNNYLTGLNVRNNRALWLLYCSNNGLTALDVSNNPVLEELVCFENDLTALNVRNNPKLLYLSCGNNHLTALDVRQNTKLKILYCGGNELSTLDVSRNTALVELVCAETKISSLNLINNKQLKLLACCETGIQKLDIGANPYLRQTYQSTYKVTYSNAIAYEKEKDVWELVINPGAKVYTVSAPGAIDVITTAVADNQVTIRWSAASGAKTYEIARRPAGGSWQTIATGITDTKYRDGTVQKGNTYQYRVRGRNDNAATIYGSWKNSDNIGVGTAPGAISSVTATAEAGKITVTWTKSANATQYVLQRREYVNSVWSDWTTSSSALTGTSYTDSSVVGGRLYQYRVRGRNSSGYGAYKGCTSIKALATTPGAISSATATAAAGKITVTWTKSANATQYDLQRREYVKIGRAEWRERA